MISDKKIHKDAKVAVKHFVIPVGDAQLGIELGELVNGDILLTAPVLSIGTVSAAEIKYTAYHFQIGGMRYTAAAGEIGFTATADDIADPDADPREIVYLLSTAAGDSEPTVTPGTIAAAGAGVAPATPSNHVVLGEVLLQHDGTAIFNATTDLLSDAHITDTYTDAVAYGETPLTDVPVFVTVPGYEFVVTGVRHYFHDVTTVLTYDVEIDGVTVLTGAATPADATEAAATLVSSQTTRQGSATAVLSVDITKDAVGTARGGVIIVTIRPYRMAADPGPIL